MKEVALALFVGSIVWFCFEAAAPVTHPARTIVQAVRG